MAQSGGAVPAANRAVRAERPTHTHVPPPSDVVYLPENRWKTAAPQTNMSYGARSIATNCCKQAGYWGKKPPQGLLTAT
ncbi:unnamed protein product [Colias eurytheme]|nr:unnamed protein product [Colias eurytheme]